MYTVNESHFNFLESELSSFTPQQSFTDVARCTQSLSNLSLQNPPFTVHFDNIQPQDIVEEFGGIIGRSGKLIHTHDFVELHSTRVPHMRLVL